MRPGNRLKPLLAGLPFGPLVEREFRLLFIGRTISLFGSAFAPIALAFAVITLTGSPADLGYVLSAYMLAHLVFLLAGGVWADRLPRHLLMVTSDILSGASQIAAAVVLLTGVAQTWHLVVLAAIRGGASAFFMPASTGLVPHGSSRRTLCSACRETRRGSPAWPWPESWWRRSGPAGLSASTGRPTGSAPSSSAC
jgi:MFS family permease